jgi:hypothetical protein
MAAEVDICNSALVKLGAEQIASLNDLSHRAILCKNQYDVTRQKLLRSHKWNFAISRVKITQELDGLGDPIEPAFGFTSQFLLPLDFLRILEVFPNNNLGTVSKEPWKVEGERILTDADSVSVIYIADITDVNQFDVTFREALAFKIAEELSYPLIQDKNVATLMRQKAQEELKETRSIDSFEGTPDPWDSDTWLAARDVPSSGRF